MAIIAFFTLSSLKDGSLVVFDRQLDDLGDSIHLAFKEFLPPLETWDGSPESKVNTESWMLLDQAQILNELTYDQFKKLCTPEYLAEIDLTQSQYQETMRLARANQKKFGPVRREILYFITANVESMEFGAVCSMLQGLRTYRFFKKSGTQWQYDVYNYPANPFSVLPYTDLDAIKKMMASGKARVDDTGKMRPINDAITTALP